MHTSLSNFIRIAISSLRALVEKSDKRVRAAVGVLGFIALLIGIVLPLREYLLDRPHPRMSVQRVSFYRDLPVEYVCAERYDRTKLERSDGFGATSCRDSIQVFQPWLGLVVEVYNPGNDPAVLKDFVIEATYEIVNEPRYSIGTYISGLEASTSESELGLPITITIAPGEWKAFRVIGLLDLPMDSAATTRLFRQLAGERLLKDFFDEMRVRAVGVDGTVYTSESFFARPYTEISFRLECIPFRPAFWRLKRYKSTERAEPIVVSEDDTYRPRDRRKEAQRDSPSIFVDSVNPACRVPRTSPDTTTPNRPVSRANPALQ